MKQIVFTGIYFSVAITLLNCSKSDKVNPTITSWDAISSGHIDTGKVLTIEGYLKRYNQMGSPSYIHESFHRAWSEGGEIQIDQKLENLESKNKLLVVGPSEGVWNKGARPLFGSFTGVYTKEMGRNGDIGTLEVGNIEFKKTDPVLFKLYNP